jgi:hypothetical protein
MGNRITPEVLLHMQRLLQSVEPVVRHGLREVQGGAPIQHALREIALMAALIGSGVPPAEAIRRVESGERGLIGFPPGGEPWERGQYPGHGYPGPGMGTRPPMGTGPWGPGAGPGPYGPTDMWRP